MMCFYWLAPAYVSERRVGDYFSSRACPHNYIIITTFVKFLIMSRIPYSFFFCLSCFALFFSPAVDFFNEINLLYGTVAEFCTQQSCAVMKAGDYEYLWMDGVKYKKPTAVSAPEYVDLLMTWVESQLNDESIFPLQMGTAFPKDFVSRVKKIFQR